MTQPNDFTWIQAWEEYPESIRRYIIIASQAAFRSIEIGDAKGAKKYTDQAIRQASNHSFKLRDSWLLEGGKR